MSLPILSPWLRIHKGDVRGRQMADRHYTRQTPGHPMWTRPGYNHVLFAHDHIGTALFCWWRPKWEDGRPGTQRKDGLRTIECTMFRREGHGSVSSQLIRAAVFQLQSEDARSDLHLDQAGPISVLVTGVGSVATSRRRSSRAKPGTCFRHAGWHELQKTTRRADVWLGLHWSNRHAAREKRQ